MKKFMSLVLAAMMVLGMAACGSKPAAPAAPAASAAPAAPADAASRAPGVATTAPTAPAAPVENWKKEVIIAHNAKFTHQDPHGATNFQNTRHYQLVYDRLVYLDTVTQKLEPMLATSWEISADNLVYTFKLRDDVTFHNGEKFTADDVVFTWERGLEAPVAMIKNFYKQVTKCEAVDDYTVKMTLDKADADFLYSRTFPYMAILNREACTADAEKGFLIGTGLWKWDEHVDNDYDTFVRFDDYYGGTTPTEKITIRLIPEASARLIALENGEVDLAINVSQDEKDYVASNPDLTLYTIDAVTTQYMNFNMEKEGPWQDQNFRRAVAHAIDWDTLILGWKSGNGVQAKTIWAPIQFGYDPGEDDFKYDIELAKEFLAKSNYNGEPLTITGYGAYSNGGLIITDMLSKIGINAVINETNSSNFTELTREGNFEAAIYQITFNAAGSDVQRLLVSSNQGRRSIEKAEFGPKIKELLDAGLATTDEAARKAAYSEIQDILAEQAYIIPLAYPTNHHATAKGVEGVKWEANTDFDYRFIKVPA